MSDYEKEEWWELYKTAVVELEAPKSLGASTMPEQRLWRGLKSSQHFPACILRSTKQLPMP